MAAFQRSKDTAQHHARSLTAIAAVDGPEATQALAACRQFGMALTGLCDTLEEKMMVLRAAPAGPAEAI